LPGGPLLGGRTRIAAGRLGQQLVVKSGQLALPGVAPGSTAIVPQPSDVALFLHTSGTTSKPKGVPLTHANLTASLSNVAATYEMSAADRSYLVRHTAPRGGERHLGRPGGSQADPLTPL